MNRMQARKKLRDLEWAAKSDKPMTNICAVLGIDPEVFGDDPAGGSFNDALRVRIADLRRAAK